MYDRCLSHGHNFKLYILLLLISIFCCVKTLYHDNVRDSNCALHNLSMSTKYVVLFLSFGLSKSRDESYSTPVSWWRLWNIVEIFKERNVSAVVERLVHLAPDQEVPGSNPDGGLHFRVQNPLFPQHLRQVRWLWQVPILREGCKTGVPCAENNITLCT